MTASRSIPAFFSLLVLLVIIGSLSFERTTYAAGVVNTCDQSHLVAAIAGGGGGGNVTFNCNGTIALSSTIIISSNTTIDGTGHHVTVDGQGSYQLFHVNASTALTLKNLTLANGHSASYSGAIYNDTDSTLNVTGCTFSNNQTNSYGGAIYSQGTAVTVSNSIFSGNSGDGGGAIRIDEGCTLDISGSTFSGNSATSEYGGALDLDGGDVTIDTSSFLNNTAWGNGGAIDHDNGTLTITRSTFSQNEQNGTSSSGAGGGAISEYSVLILANSTFSENSSLGVGGAILSLGTTTIANCTFSRNSAATGGSIYVSSRTTTLTNTIVADSTSGGNCGGTGTITNGGNNLQFGDNSCDSIPVPLSDPLGSNVLANNGGPTMTIALPVGSAAIDAGNDGVCSADPVNGIDQRGIIRPRGPQCDIGAYEYSSAAAVTVPTLTGWGMIIFMLLAGLVAVYYLRRQRIADS